MTQSLKERTAKGLFWGGFSNLFQQIIQLGFGVFMGRILYPEDFGLVGMLAIFTLLSIQLQEGGFSIALINKQHATQQDYSTVFWINVIISFLLYILLFLSSPFIAQFFNQPLLIDLSKVVFLSFVFSAFGLVQNTILTKEIKMRELAVVNLVSIFISCSVGLVLALLDFSYWAFAIQTITLPFVRTITLWIVSNWRPSFVFNTETIKEIFPFSIKMLLSGLMSQLSNGMYSLLLGKYYDEKEVGYYSQGNKWAAIPYGIVNNLVNVVALPVLAEVNGEADRQYTVFRKMLRFTSFISFPLILGFGFVSGELIPILITDRWNESIPIIQILCIWGSIAPLAGLYQNILTVRGYSGNLLLLNFIYGLCLITTLILTVKFGVVNMLLCTLGVNLLYMAFTIYVVKRKIGFNISGFFKDVFPFLGFTIVIFGIIHLCLSMLENVYLLLFLKISLSVFLYFLIMKVSKIVIFQETIRFAQSKMSGLFTKNNR